MNDVDPRQREVDRYLRSLPGALPPAELGARIVNRHLARRARRRWLPLAAAASLLLALVAWQQLSVPPAPPVAPVLAAGDSSALIDLRAVDRRLQSAYLAGASEAELASLWLARNQALAELESGGGQRERRQVRL